jgi:hypothetical protein
MDGEGSAISVLPPREAMSVPMTQATMPHGYAAVNGMPVRARSDAVRTRARAATKTNIKASQSGAYRTLFSLFMPVLPRYLKTFLFYHKISDLERAPLISRL